MADSTSGNQLFDELSQLVTSVLSGENVAEEVAERYVKDFSDKPGFQQPAGAQIDGNEVTVLGANGDVLAKFKISADGSGSWEQNGQAAAPAKAAAPAQAAAAPAAAS